jgi:hypothetical protein
MGGIWKSMVKGSRNLGHILENYPVYGQILGVAAGAVDKGYRRKAAQPVLQRLAAPTIDDAAMRQQEQDRLSKRRGVLSNIYGGAKNQTPTVQMKKLLGE